MDSLWQTFSQIEDALLSRHQLVSFVAQVYTLYLFTRSDFKTVMLPVTTFAVVAVPMLPARHLITGIFWLWCHLLPGQHDLANQTSSSSDEDRLNRPWRPLPSGRISRRDAVVLRWAVCIWCLAFSACLSLGDVGALSLAFALATFLHNDLGWSDHWHRKNVCNALAYGIFEWGTTTVAAGGRTLDDSAKLSVLISALVILSTIQMQDFGDVRGDKAVGRMTLPIYFPTPASKVFTAGAVIAWSLVLGIVWAISPSSHTLIVLFGAWIAYRILFLSDSETCAARSYVYYTVWLVTIHLLPIVAHHLSTGRPTS